jgi:2'-5' RNA ligase
LRLFVALEVAEVARRELRRRLAGVRDRLPRARWVDLDSVHLTLMFLGEVEPQQVPALAARLAAAFAPFAPLPLRLDGGGTFPPGRPARVAWVGVDAPPALFALQHAIERAACAELGLPAEERPYTAHVTLARCPDPWRREAIDKITHALDGPIGPPFTARGGALLESKLTPRGAQHRVLHELPLLGAMVEADPEADEAPEPKEGQA